MDRVFEQRSFDGHIFALKYHTPLHGGGGADGVCVCVVHTAFFSSSVNLFFLFLLISFLPTFWGIV